MLVNVYWTTVVEVRWYTLDSTSLPLFIIPIFILFVITVLNIGVGWLSPQRRLSSGELVVVYVMLVVSGSLSGHDMIQNLFGSIAHAFWYAAPENRWEDLFLNSYPNWLAVADRDLLEGFYLGDSSMYSFAVLRAWLPPLLWWTLLMSILIAMMLCLNTLVRRQWTENEKLAYPIIQLPIAMTRPEAAASFFANRFMWYGFGLAAFIDLVNGLNVLYPNFPRFSYIKLYPWHDLITDRPWNAIRPLMTSMYPFAIGLAYFLPLDLSFSCWFFFLARFAQQLSGAMFGWERAKGFPYFNQQGAGAWLVLGVSAVWGTRVWLKEIFTSLLSRQARDRNRRLDADEPMPFSLALAVISLGIVGLFWFSQRMGMGWLTSSVFYFVFFTFSLAIARVRAEFGAPHEIVFAQPRRIIADLFGTKRFPVAELTAISSMHWYNRGYRCHPMPNQLEGFKMAQLVGIPQRTMLWTLIFSFAVGIPMCYWANLHLCYREGAITRCRGFKNWVGWEAFNQLHSWLLAPLDTHRPNTIAMIVGGAIVLVLRWLRLRFTGLPFHHAGYALAISYAMDYFWFAFFVSWLAKSVILKFGGISAHRAAMPFFLGLILGDYVAGSCWAIYGPLRGVATYKIYI